jgi:hypothetical protein
MVKSSSMLIKGSLLALLIAIAYADDTTATGGTPDRNPRPDNGGNGGGDKTVSYGGGKPTQASGSRWGSGWVRGSRQRGSGQARARTGQARVKTQRRRWGRPANWVRPNPPANNNWVKPADIWEKPSESESLDVEWDSPSWDGDTHEPTPTPTQWSDDGHQVCDVVSHFFAFQSKSNAIVTYFAQMPLVHLLSSVKP